MNYRISAPFYRDQEGNVHRLAPQGGNLFTDGVVEAVLSVRPQDDRWTVISHTWRALNETVSIQPVIEVVDQFRYESYIIPCVTIHGNRWGTGKEPKGLVLDGKPWVFEGRRTGIPGCTLTETANEFCALYASNDSEQSLTVSCSMEPLPDGRMAHRLLYPTIEEPKTYCGRDGYVEAYQSYITLNPGESFAATANVLSGTPVRKNFAMIDVQNAVMSYLDQPMESKLSREEIWNLSIRFAESLYYDYKGTLLLNIGHRLSPNGPILREGFEFGWCGQNGMFSRMLILDYRKNGNKEHLDAALRIMDAWAAEYAPETGLPWVHYEQCGKQDALSDTCNLGYYISEMMRCYVLLQEMGIDRPAYRDAAIRVADFFVNHYSETDGFGKAWRVTTGECLDPNGTIGAFPVFGLVEVYNHTKDERYLEIAKKALQFYVKRDLMQFECTAGALDTHCIDKETSAAIILGGLALYEATKDAQYLESAELAAEYFCAWMFYYDVPCSEESDFKRYGFRSIGGTSVSTQHHHLDPWGALMVSCFVRIARYTKNPKWRKRAEALWFNATQMIAPYDGYEVHGMARMAGSQNEAYLHSRWNWESHAAVPGTANDWLVAWPAAFRMNSIAELEKMGETI